jgi:HEAT repeat protein/energy-coupling factor transporter ATP-binding protein EcfA2
MGFVDAELRKRRSLFWDSLDFSEEKEKKTIQSDDLLRDGTRAVITGAPGCGKSTLLRWLVGKALNDASPCLPVFLELKSINEELFKACQGKLIELLFELAIAQPLHFERQSECEYLKAEFMERLAQRQVAIFLDGLDEVRNTVFFEELCRSIDSFIGSDYGRNLLIVSTRPYALDALFQDTKEMEIQPLNQDQIAAFLHHYYDGDPRLNVNALLQKLQRRELSDMIRAPILLGALVKRYREKGETELTGDRLKLYEDLTHDLAVTVGREKNVKRYSFSDKESRRNLEFLEQIAFKRLFDERIESDAQRLTFEGDWILNEAKEFCSQVNIDAYDFAADVKATPLLREVAEDVWAFSHITIQEYLAARALTKNPDGEAIFCRAYFNPTLVEMEALPMALGLSKEPDKLYQVIERLPESLNFANLRLRARGLAYGAEISHSLFEPLVDRLIDFVGKAYIEETSYSSSIIRSFSGVGNRRSGYIGERVQQLFKSEDSDVRCRAADALGEIGGEQAIAGLIEALKDQDFDVSWRAAEALGEIGGEQAVPGLIEASKDEDSFARRSAAVALGEIGGEQAVAVLIEASKDQSSFVRSPVAEALGKIGGEQAVAVLIEASKDQDSDVSSRAASALGKIGGEQAVAVLIEALKDEYSDVRGRAASALGEIGGEQAVAVLIEASKDEEDSGVRWRAAEALGEIGGEQAVAVLIETLKDQYIHVGSHAAEALDLMKIESLTKGLQAATSHQNGFVRRKAAKVIGYYSIDAAEKELKRLLENDPDLEVKQVAENALTQLELKKRYFGHSADGDS